MTDIDYDKLLEFRLKGMDVTECHWQGGGIAADVMRFRQDQPDQAAWHWMMACDDRSHNIETGSAKTLGEATRQLAAKVEGEMKWHVALANICRCGHPEAWHQGVATTESYVGCEDWATEDFAPEKCRCAAFVAQSVEEAPRG